MERNNEASLNRQRQRRQRNKYAEDLIDPVTGQNFNERIDYFNELQSSGKINNTEDLRELKIEIKRLEESAKQAQEQFKQTQEGNTRREVENKDSSESSGNGMPSFSERERAAGLNLAGNDTMSGRGQDDLTMDEREAAAGLRGTTSGRDFSEQQERQTRGNDTETELPDEQTDDPLGTFGVIVVINNRPHAASVYGQLGNKLANPE